MARSTDNGYWTDLYELDANLLREKLEKLLDPVKLDLMRQRFDLPPPPFPRSPPRIPHIPGQVPMTLDEYARVIKRKKRRGRAKVSAYNSTRAASQFDQEVKDEKARLKHKCTSNGQRRLKAQGRKVDFEGLAVAVVRDRWKREGIWNSRWNDEGYRDQDTHWSVSDYIQDRNVTKAGESRPPRDVNRNRWRHEEPDSESESRPEAIAEADQRHHTSSPSAPPSQQNHPVRRKTDEENQDQGKCNREASRPCHRFEYALAQVRQKLEEPSTKQLHEIWRKGRIWDEGDSTQLNMLQEYWRRRGIQDDVTSWQPDYRAYNIVKDVWRQRQIWDEDWTERPGTCWHHEIPFESFNRTFASRIAMGAQIPGANSTPTEQEGPQAVSKRVHEWNMHRWHVSLLRTSDHTDALDAAVWKAAQDEGRQPRLPILGLNRIFGVVPERRSPDRVPQNHPVGPENSANAVSSNQVPSQNTATGKAKGLPLGPMEGSGVSEAKSEPRGREPSAIPRGASSPEARDERRRQSHGRAQVSPSINASPLRRSARIAKRIQKAQQEQSGQGCEAKRAADVRVKRKIETTVEPKTKKGRVG
ncbi:MAG: hypothetical protein M1816_006335 [Peltula sp. TS41687]|nr:MAG: hypothetical protein M1816_006335 [Peltula sp. TS41687]